MITNFETETYELTPQELELIPILIQGFSKHGKDNPILSRDIVSSMQSFLDKRGINTKFTDARLRKCVNYIRSNAMLPLIATSNGYYISADVKELSNQIKSLRERAYSIQRCADGLYQIYKTKWKT